MIRLDPSLNATLVGFINYSANCSAQFLGQWVCTSSFEGLYTLKTSKICRKASFWKNISKKACRGNILVS